MSKKLLSEAQVRRFQNLASIKPLHEMESLAPAGVEAITEEEMEMDAGEELEMGDEAPADEEPAEEPAEEADVELDEELVEQFMDAVSVIQQVSDALGGAEEMEMGPEEPVGEETPEEAPMELDAGDEEMPADEEEEMLEEALKGISYAPSQKEVVKLVAKRVAKRLQEAKLAQRRLNKALGKK